MDRFTYERVRARREDLNLPAWSTLTNTDRHKAKRLGVAELCAKRAARLLVREQGKTDRNRVTARRDKFWGPHGWDHLDSPFRA